MDRWYETLVEGAAGLGLCSEDGDFGPEWQGISEHDMETMDGE